jgi:hypothetical protein
VVRCSLMPTENYAREVARRATVEWEAGTKYVPIGASFWVPARFVLTVKDARYPVRLEAEVRAGRAECVAITPIPKRERPPGEPGPPLTVRLDDGTRLEAGPPLAVRLLHRLPLESLLREATFAIATERRRLPRDMVDPLREWATPDAKGNVEVIAPVSGRADGKADFDNAYRRPKAKRAPRVLTDDHLQRVAEIYLAADKLGESTAAAIAREFRIPEPLARKWVMKARGAHFLPPSKRKRPEADADKPRRISESKARQEAMQRLVEEHDQPRPRNRRKGK